MPSLTRLLVLVASAVCVVAAQGQRWALFPKNIDSETNGGVSTSDSVSAVSKRQAYGDSELEILTKKVASAIFAIGLIETNQDDSECQVDDYWVESYNYLGLYGNYIQDLM